LLSKLLTNPTIGRTLFKIIKGRAFRPYNIPVEAALEKQEEILSSKFGRMEGTEMGRRLGVHRGMRLEEAPTTDYGFYEDFFTNPSANGFIYPISEYERVRTSGTSGSEKWFMIPRHSFVKCWETGLATLMAMFHDGEKVDFEYGDLIYVNVAPRPFSSGHVLSYLERETYDIIRLVPNINLSFKDKIKYFTRNYDKIDGAVMLASTLISRVIPEIEGPIKLKGLLTLDSQIGEIYENELRNFAGTPPRTIYATTETLNCTVPSVQHRLSFFFDWKRGIFEFYPIDREGNNQVKCESLVPMNEVKVEEIYQPVFTSLEGEMTRYVINDSLLCVALGDDIVGMDFPVFSFHSRLEKNISLQNFTRISEEELLMAFRHNNIRFVDFTARCEVEKGLERLAVYVEQVGNMSAEEIEECLHNYLYDVDRDYRDLVNFFSYNPVKVYIVPRGTFCKYMERKDASWGKVERINMREEEFRKIIANG